MCPINPLVLFKVI